MSYPFPSPPKSTPLTTTAPYSTPSQPLPVYGTYNDLPAHNTVRAAAPPQYTPYPRESVYNPSVTTNDPRSQSPLPLQGQSALPIQSNGRESRYYGAARASTYRESTYSRAGSPAGSRDLKMGSNMRPMTLVDQYRAPALNTPLERSRLSVGMDRLWPGGKSGDQRMDRASEDGLDSKDAELEVVDQRLKKHIRILRLISRILAFVVSILVFVPITMTLIKFLQTRTIFRVVTNPTTGETLSRTAWARNTTTWPTYMYFGVAAVSLLLNLFIMVSYLRKDIGKANTGAYIATTFSWIFQIANAVVYGVAASLYRTEKKNDDLWGWTCGAQAASIQRVFEREIDFGTYCNVQSYSWYAGIVQALLAILTIIVLYLVVRRRKVSKKVKAGEKDDMKQSLLTDGRN